MLIPQYLRFFFLSGLGIDKINRGIGGTTGQLVIKTSYFKSLKVSIPKSIDDQHSIIRKAEEIQSYTFKLVESFQKKLILLEELKKSILQKAFSGELTNKSVAA